MPEIGTYGSTSGDGKRGDAAWPKLPRPSSTLPKLTFRLTLDSRGGVARPRPKAHGKIARHPQEATMKQGHASSSSNALASFKSSVSKALSEPVIDRGEKIVSLLSLTLITPQSGHARRGAQFPGFLLAADARPRAR